MAKQLARTLMLGAGRVTSGLLASSGPALQVLPQKLVSSISAVEGASQLWSSSVLFSQTSHLHFSASTSQESSPDIPKATSPKNYEPARKYRSLADKELWHEAWMYEDKFGTEEDPIFVPCLEGERIIGVTDPEDDNLVVWGILRADEPPRQFIEGGEYYILKVVPYVQKVGDVVDKIEAGTEQTPLSK